VTAVWLERRKQPRTANDLIARTMHERRKVTKEWREWAAQEAEGIRPITGPVTVTVQVLRENGVGMPDAGSAFLTAKAVVDGIVDAKVLPGDGPAVVRSITLEAPVVAGYHGLRVIVRPIEQHAIKDQPAPSTGPLPILPQPIPGETA
jgi:hypothetical protein